MSGRKGDKEGGREERRREGWEERRKEGKREGRKTGRHTRTPALEAGLRPSTRTEVQAGLSGGEVIFGTKFHQKAKFYHNL